MKRFIISAIIIAVSFVTAAQSPGSYNFRIENGALVWQKVYSTKDSCSIKAIINTLMQRGFSRDITVLDGDISCEFRIRRLEYKSLGYKHGQLQVYITNDEFTGFTTIQVKPDRYRVTVSRIRCHHPHYGTSGLEAFAVDGKRFNTQFLERSAHVIDANLSALFDSLNNTLQNDDW